MRRNRAAVWSYRKRNGWTKKRFHAAMRVQDKRCAICGILLVDSRAEGEKLVPGFRKVAADHDHATGQPRGILCNTCNSMLGHAHDNPDVLEKGAAYLRFHGK